MADWPPHRRPSTIHRATIPATTLHCATRISERQRVSVLHDECAPEREWRPSRDRIETTVRRRILRDQARRQPGIGGDADAQAADLDVLRLIARCEAKDGQLIVR